MTTWTSARKTRKKTVHSMPGRHVLFSLDRGVSVSTCKAMIPRCKEAINWRSPRMQLLFLGRFAAGRITTGMNARAEAGTRAPLRLRHVSTGSGHFSTTRV
jgi:hypothetical protein